MIDFSSIFFCNTPFQIVSWSVKLYRLPLAHLKTYFPFYPKRLFSKRPFNLYWENIIMYNQLIKY